MPLQFAAIMPHGYALIPGLGEQGEASPALTRTMKHIAREARAAELESLILATPHGIRVFGAHSISTSSSVAGGLGDHLLELPIDGPTSNALLGSAAKRGIECRGVVYGGESIPLPMDWGTFIPLWFLAEEEVKVPVTLICPSRELSLESLAGLGEIIAELSEQGHQRFGLIASADQSHVHMEKGPYGFHPSAKPFDREVTKFVRAGDMEKVLSLDEDLIKTALPDSPWQMAILAGAFRRVAFDVATVSYACPSYFGMLCALFTRRDASKGR